MDNTTDMATLPPITRGTTYQLTYQYLTGPDVNNLTPGDITGATVFFTVKKQESDNPLDDSKAVIVKTNYTHYDPTNGMTIFSLNQNDTFIPPGGYYWDIRINTSGLKRYATNWGYVSVEGTPTNRSVM